MPTPITNLPVQDEVTIDGSTMALKATRFSIKHVNKNRISIILGGFQYSVIITFVFAASVMGSESMMPFKCVPIVEDVDSFWVEGAHIRLQGIDGPEVSGRREAAGNDATHYLYELTRGKELVCVPDGEMTRGRFVSTCTLPDGRDLGDAIIRAGYARDCPFFSGGRYAEAEHEASAAGRGLWARDLMPPAPAPYCLKPAD